MSETASSHSGLYAVIQKGEARCMAGSTTCGFKVTTHSLQHANGNDPENLIVTEEDLSFAQAPPFGSCSLKNGNTCSYAPQGKWQNTYPKIKVLGKNILTEASTLACATGGTITVDVHGQSQELVNAHFDNVELEELLMVSPLAGKPEPGKEMPQVKTIEVQFPQRSGNGSSRKNEAKDKTTAIPEVIVRKDEELVFRVSSYYNKTVSKVDKSKVNWIVYNGKGYESEKLSLLEYGEELKLNFDDYGDYHVHAYGKTPKDSRCSFVVQVKQNELTQEGIQTQGGNIAGDKLRRGAVTPFQVQFIFPPDAEEKKRVRMYVKDPSGAEADGVVYNPETGLLFTPKNTGDYTVYADYTRENGSLQQVSKKYKSINNSVSKITATPSADKYRPGTTITFEVSQMKFSFLADDDTTWDRGEYSRIKWNVNGKQVSTVGRKYTATFTTPGTYIVESYVMEANAHKKKEEDDWRFTITKNKVSGFTCGLAKNLLVGNTEEVVATTLIDPYQATLDGTITWKSNNPGIQIVSSSGTKAQIKAVGDVAAGVVTAELNGASFPLLITASKAEIKRWCITDKGLDFKRFAGWDEELYGLIESTPLLAGQKVTMHLLEGFNANEGIIRRENNTSHLYKIGEAVFDEKGIAKAQFKTDSSLKKKLEAKGKLGKWEKEGEEYELFLVIENTSIQFKDSAETTIEGVKYQKPKKEIKHNGHEQNLYTFIDNKRDITSIRFLKPNGKDAYEIIGYGEKITLKAQTRNLNGTQLNLKNIIKNNLGSGIKEYPQNVKTTVKNETASWSLNTGVWRDWAKDKSGVALYQVELEEADGDKLKYPGDIARLKDGSLDWKKLITYQTLKLSDNTTLSELAKTNAPLIIGEPLEEGGSGDNGKCPNCEKDITWEEVKDIFGDNDKDFRMACIKWINSYKLRFDINTCVKKAHFLSQIAAETHFRKNEMAEGYIKYIPKNIRSGIFGDRAIKLEKRGQIEEFCSERPEQKKLFNFLYAGENGFGNGNGNEASGDGFKFRGKGLIQLTGKGNYKSAMGIIYESFPKDIYANLIKEEERTKNYNEFSFEEKVGKKYMIKKVNKVNLFNFLDYSDMLLEPKYAVLSAFADWKSKGLSDSSLMINNISNVKKIRKIINAAGLNTNVAEEYFKKSVKTLMVDQCSIPLAKENGGKWHDPVDNPICTIFTQNQIAGEFNDAGKHWGLFGKTRGTATHYGLDLFAVPGTLIYACVKCEVYNIVTDDNVPKGYGKQIFLKVLDKETFLLHYKNYSKIYPNLEYETISDFSKDKDILLHYAHLKKIYVKKGWTINNINIPIGETGVSGVTQGGKEDGTCAPHLHFEIRNIDKSRINPGFFIEFKDFTKMNNLEKLLQQKTAKNGKIKEFYGKKDEYRAETDYK